MRGLRTMARGALRACALLLPLGALGCALFLPPAGPTRAGLQEALLRYEHLIERREWPSLLDEAYLPFDRENVKGLWEGVFGRWLLAHLVGERALRASWGLALAEEKGNWQEVVEGFRDFNLEVLAIRRGPPLADFEPTFYVHYRLALDHAKFKKPLRAEGVMQWGYAKRGGRWVRLVPVPGDGVAPPGRPPQSLFPGHGPGAMRRGSPGGV